MSVVPPVLVAAAVAATAVAATTATALPAVYRPPVDAPVADPFRPPASPYGPGNRGLHYATARGTPVHAAASGVVVFAGPVGGSFAVSVAHADGLRTTYSSLGSVSVGRGARVAEGDEVGRAGAGFHFGARIGAAYVDPQLLFGPDPHTGARRARLVRNDDGERP